MGFAGELARRRVGGGGRVRWGRGAAVVPCMEARRSLRTACFLPVTLDETGSVFSAGYQCSNPAVVEECSDAVTQRPPICGMDGGGIPMSELVVCTWAW